MIATSALNPSHLAASLIDAGRRLRQMYLQREILERREQNVRASNRGHASE
jgi:hypothetical protein